MRVQVNSYKQNEQEFLSVILPISSILNTSEILIYGSVDGGYQRKPNPLHIKRITKYILGDKQSFIFPSSIIFGADDNIKKSISTDENGTWLEIDENKKIFRIVDGQHRIEGLREAIKQDSSLNNFPLHVIIALSKEEKRSIELQIFTDINSKAKKINTDLAELARYEYELIENQIDKENINRHIGIKTAYNLKRKSGSVWENAIKFDIHAEVAVGIIGVKLFSESISKLIDKYRKDHPISDDDPSSVIRFCNQAAEHLSQFLSEIWDNTIKQKWEFAFKKDFITDDEGAAVIIQYSKDHYLQKGIGIHSLNPIIGDIVLALGFEESKAEINKIISESKVTTNDWQTRGPFSGFNSGSGFAKVRSSILNEHPITPD